MREIPPLSHETAVGVASRAVTRRVDGPVARKLRLDLIRNVTTQSSFLVYIWLWQFMLKTTAMKPTVLDQRNLLDLHILVLVH